MALALLVSAKLWATSKWFPGAIGRQWLFRRDSEVVQTVRPGSAN